MAQKTGKFDFVSEEKKASLLKGCRAFIYPVEHEDFGMATLEAMHFGKPAIVLNQGGFRDYLKDGYNGIFIKEPTVDSVANASVISLLSAEVLSSLTPTLNLDIPLDKLFMSTQENPIVDNKVVATEANFEEEVKTENTGAEKAKLFPTDIGMVVNDFLQTHFSFRLGSDATQWTRSRVTPVLLGLSCRLSRRVLSLRGINPRFFMSICTPTFGESAN